MIDAKLRIVLDLIQKLGKVKLNSCYDRYAIEIG